MTDAKTPCPECGVSADDINQATDTIDRLKAELAAATARVTELERRITAALEYLDQHLGAG